MPQISILLSTINNRIFSTEKILTGLPADCECVIVHQLTENENAEPYDVYYKKFETNERIHFIPRFEKGTGKSRNCALENATGELLYICDDDISLNKDFYTTIPKTAEKHPEIDIFCFMISDTEANPYKKYYSSEKLLNLHETAKVSNVEMVIRKSFIEKSNVRFDERFGLGTIFNTGEEFVFLADAKRKGAAILFVPQYIAVHPKESSGKLYAKELIEAKGAMIHRVYGLRFLLINFLYAVKKHSEYKSKIHFFRFLLYIYRGSFQFYKYD